MAHDLLSINDLSAEDVASVLDAADGYRRRQREGQPLAGKTVAMIFEKPSLRTKVSFDVAAYELGGHGVFLQSAEVGLDTREPVEDIAHVLERWASAIVARVNDHRTLERLAEASSVPVVNALSDVEHPCQALADLLTVRQHRGSIEGAKVTYVGDANNCALSLALACGATGASFAIASPAGYELGSAALAAISRASVSLQATNDPLEAVDGADVVYTDVWTSMGQEAETEARRKAFEGFQVNQQLLDHASPSVLLMHPMPAHYGDEVPAGMLDHPRSVAYDQAENRLHAQKAILELLVAGS